MTVTWQFFKLDARAITGLEASRAPHASALEMRIF